MYSLRHNLQDCSQLFTTFVLYINGYKDLSTLLIIREVCYRAIHFCAQDFIFGVVMLKAEMLIGGDKGDGDGFLK